MRPDVARAFDRMAAAARADGVDLLITSAFRSDAEQAPEFTRPTPTPSGSLHRTSRRTGSAPSSTAALRAHTDDFGMEQEASTVDQWFARHAAGWTNVADLRRRLGSESAMRDPYFQYIANNIRMADG